MQETNSVATTNKTLREVYETQVNAIKNKRKLVIAAVSKNGKSMQIWNDIVAGRKIPNQAERKAIADIFGVPVDSISWPEKKNLIA